VFTSSTCLPDGSVGKVASAQRVFRPGTTFEEQVNCTVRYGGGAVVNFYHGFTQPNRMDRQQFRLLFEKGDLTLEEWVPVSMRISAAVNELEMRNLMDLFPGARLDITAIYGGKDRIARGRHKVLDLYQRSKSRSAKEGEDAALRGIAASHDARPD
jgi:hypothetical protein